MNGKKLTIALVAGVLALSGALAYRAHQTAVTDRTLCGVLYRIIAGNAANTGKPGTPGYAYYHAHPDELRAARAANASTLKQLDCDHLPSGGG